MTEAPDQPPTPMLRKLFLRAVLAFLVVTAVVAIASVWTDVDHDGRILASSAAISFASLLAMSGAALLDRGRSSLGAATIVLGGAAASLTLYAIWGNPHADLFAKLLLSTWLWAFASSLHSLVALARLPASARWLSFAAPLTSYFATIFVTGLIFEVIEADEHAYYIVSTAYILTTLASLATLIVHLMHRGDRPAPVGEMLTLVAVEGEIFQDPSSAKRYRVTAIN